MATSDWLISATPPTPNGDLHVGHMSGPYLAADIFKRARAVLGDSAVYVCYGDDNQSYVVTTADRLNTTPKSLVETGNSDIAATLEAYNIDIDQYARPDSQHEAVVGDAVRLLIEKNLIIERDVFELRQPDTNLPLYEALASGICNICIAETKGGICESCGHPNDPIDLLPMTSGDDLTQPPYTAKSRRLVLPIEDYRDELIDFYYTKRGIWRPHLIQLVDELLSKPLADFPMSHPTRWGIPIGIPGWDGHSINVWGEMGIGLLHLLGQHRTNTQINQGRYVQFLGFDNSYFFAIVHPVLQFALKRAGMKKTKLPEFIFTNEFYHLDNKKFSSSKGHAMWGRELLHFMNIDEARFYLSLQGPELAEANFNLNDARQTVRDELTIPLQRLKSNLKLSSKLESNLAERETCVSTHAHDRISFFCQPETFSPRALARMLSNILLYLGEIDPNELNARQLDQYLELLDALIIVANIITPGISADLISARDRSDLHSRG